MIALLYILALLNGFSLGVFLNENNNKLTISQILLFILMIFIGIFVLLFFILFHEYIDYKNRNK
jgi:hypothetical protein